MGTKTLNPLVAGSSPARVTSGGGVLSGEAAGAGPRKPVTIVTWAFAPDWLTAEEASELSGFDAGTLRWLIEDGSLDTRYEGDGWLIEKLSLWEYQEALLDVLSCSV